MEGDGSSLTDRFSGERVEIEPGVVARVGNLDHSNAVAVREICEIARPQPLGLADSFGLGDRLGVAGPAHLRAMRDSGFRAVLAQ
ncbi:MAG: tagaturonate epimerase family protein, partial [Acidobacteriota bacterium]